ncbi:G-type lectin S-receptor-like serine/threonine-protein kinase At4g27290 [Cynara cardunculus var. scolymus]|uniref:G-type lectin S-receptor-like serine/threonine-protein kinase At4g27290 n=1 Tax=Cynara cardunculus var. scolymus TaxID=59895 RepID=UPI000D623F36|nr:G-type lectin S-receptor-like serine/threonine-protein kinase At4g27290 [Cynara cardunculus var. scolymus]
MEDLFTSLLISTALFLLLFSPSVAVDNIAANQVIKDGETIVSAGEMYEMGFFSPANSNNRYLGIWFKKTAMGTVVWVANRDLPISDTSGTFKVSSEGLLLLSYCDDTVIWSSTCSTFVRYINPVAQLLDTGNFVVKDGNSTDQTDLIWQSFDYPGDTWLPGMKFGKDFVAGVNRNLTSWKSTNDPSVGQYVNYVDTNGYPQMLLRQGLVVRLRVGPWNGMRFSGLPDEIPNPIYSIDYAINQKEIYYKYDLTSSSVVQMVHLTWDGIIEMMHWNNRSQDWFVYATGPVDTCGRYGICGPYGSCDINKNPPCSCMDGFEPKRPDEWSMADWSSGCRFRTPLDCQAPEVFWKIRGMKFPDTRQSWYDHSMTLGECEIACRKNCSCTAYANIDVRRGGSGCLLWFGALMDLKVCGESQYLYIRMPASLLKDDGLTISQSGFNKKIRVLTVTLSISLVLLGMSLAAYVCNKKKKRSSTQGRGHRVYAFDKRDSNVVKEDIELNFISLSKVVKATNNFSIDNKLGQGGFGPVYKGVLESGEEIAVKKLSETSEQGYGEFYNEVVCVARLQHRNLVKLLGYCMDGNERILIYEYLSNKSLDLHLFDETKSSMLEWPLRLDIIRGIAKGILYLHQDSRHRIIHRDLKASNILLDHDMNPKISDFGLAREFGGDQMTAKTKKVVGTHGYISPEYAIHGRFSVKSDVFSFGVLVLEMVSGKKNREFSHEDVNDNLLGHTWRLYTESKYVELMCPSFRNSCIVSEVKRTIHVGLLCVQNLAQDRPTMSYVVRMLSGNSALPPPKQPAFFVGEDLPNPGLFSAGVDEASITTLEPR